MKKLLSLGLILILCFAFAACGNNEEIPDPSDIVNPITLHISIIDNDLDDVVPEDFTPVENVEFVAEEGSSALEATQVYCVSEELGYELSADGTYFTSIAGVEASDTVGWTFTVNGETPLVGAGEIEVKDGDTIVWEYIDYSNMSWG